MHIHMRRDIHCDGSLFCCRVDVSTIRVAFRVTVREGRATLGSSLHVCICKLRSQLLTVRNTKAPIYIYTHTSRTKTPKSGQVTLPCMQSYG